MDKRNGNYGQSNGTGRQKDLSALLAERDAYTVPQTRQRLGGISQESYYGLVKSGALKTFLIGTRRYTSPEAIAAFIRKRESEPAPLAKSTRRKSTTGEPDDC